MAIVRSHRGHKLPNSVREITKDILHRQVTVNGEETVVAEQIIWQRAMEAMQENDVRGLAIAASEFLFDRAEGKPTARQEVSGPDGGPIEVVQEHRVLAKLFD